MRVLNSQELLAVTGATLCHHAIKPVCAPKVCLPKLDLTACLTGLLAKFKTCAPVKPTCPTTPVEVETPEETVDPVDPTAPEIT